MALRVGGLRIAAAAARCTARIGCTRRAASSPMASAGHAHSPLQLANLFAKMPAAAAVAMSIYSRKAGSWRSVRKRRERERAKCSEYFSTPRRHRQTSVAAASARCTCESYTRLHDSRTRGGSFSLGDEQCSVRSIRGCATGEVLSVKVQCVYEVVEFLCRRYFLMLKVYFLGTNFALTL